jgi:hypothetical protein
MILLHPLSISPLFALFPAKSGIFVIYTEGSLFSLELRCVGFERIKKDVRRLKTAFILRGLFSLELRCVGFERMKKDVRRLKTGFILRGPFFLVFVIQKESLGRYRTKFRRMGQKTQHLYLGI